MAHTLFRMSTQVTTTLSGSVAGITGLFVKKFMPSKFGGTG